MSDLDEQLNEFIDYHPNDFDKKLAIDLRDEIEALRADNERLRAAYRVTRQTFSNLALTSILNEEDRTIAFNELANIDKALSETP